MIEALNNLSGQINHLLEHFFAPPMYGNSVVGLTQYIFWMLVAILIMLVVFFVFKKRQTLVPHGRFVNLIELLVEFVRTDVIVGTVGRKTAGKHAPFLLTVFFFILFNNVLGMIPGIHPGTGTIGVTLAIALCSFLYFVVLSIRLMGVGGYIRSFKPEGIVLPIALLVAFIEVLSAFLRLVTLAIRLFANMFAGHVAMGIFALLISCTTVAAFNVVNVLSFVQLLAPAAVIAILVLIYAIELLVAFIQAYVFTMLSGVYIQLAETEAAHQLHAKEEKLARQQVQESPAHLAGAAAEGQALA